MANHRGEKDFRESLLTREKLIPQFNMMKEKDKTRLQKELQADHQKALLQEARSAGEEKKHWQQLRWQIETQAQQISAEDKVAYQKLTTPMTPKPTAVKNTVIAFIVGGLICVIGQLIMNYAVSLGLGTKEAGAVTSTALVFGGALLTGLGIYDELGRYAGAGSIVPISGFANSIVSSALEFKREGFVYGVGAHLFTIAGPVLAYGTVVSIFVGLVYYLVQ